MTLDIPVEVRNKALADGASAWLDELPGIVAGLAADWSLTVGATLHGGHIALVVEASLADGTPAVLKIGVPGTTRELGFEATVLRLAGGEGCARLLNDDLDRGALLLERLGATMHEVVPDQGARQDLLCDLAVRLWRPVDAEVDLPTGADQAEEYATLLPRLWEQTGRACSRKALDDALACAGRRHGAHEDRRAVLVHGDVHEFNALAAADGTFKFIDPDGLHAEPERDLATILRNNPGVGDDLRMRAERLAARTGLDATAIWEWGTVLRVMSGLYSKSIGFQPFGDLLLADADRIASAS